MVIKLSCKQKNKTFFFHELHYVEDLSLPTKKVSQIERYISFFFFIHKFSGDEITQNFILIKKKMCVVWQ